MEVRKEVAVMMFIFGGLTGAITAPTETDIRTLIDELSVSLPREWESYPINGLANGLANATGVESPIGIRDMSAWRNYLADTPPAPINPNWRVPFQEATRDATERYFADAQRQFDRGNIQSATEDLCRAVSCTIIGQAAILGWPHSNRDDDLNAMVGLATGILPKGHDDITTLLESASDDGHSLNSNYAATMGMPHAVRQHYFQENGYTPPLVFSFAKKAVELANKLGDNLS